MIKVMLVDDHELVRMGIKCILDDTKGIVVVGETSSGEEAVLLAKILVPDIILIDVNMPGIGGLEATRRILSHNQNIKIIVLTVCENEPYPSRFIQEGAKGYLSKGCGQEEVIAAIRAVYQGKHHLSEGIAQKIAFNRLSKKTTQCELLSAKELQIVIMITQGMNVEDIASKLFLSSKTICGYRYRIFDKLGISSDVQLTLMAKQLGIIDNFITDEK